MNAKGLTSSSLDIFDRIRFHNIALIDPTLELVTSESGLTISNPRLWSKAHFTVLSALRLFPSYLKQILRTTDYVYTSFGLLCFLSPVISGQNRVPRAQATISHCPNISATTTVSNEASRNVQDTVGFA